MPKGKGSSVTLAQVGDDDAEVTPVPIPNTEVKLCSADDTWREAAWESRKLPAMNEAVHLDCFFRGCKFIALIFCIVCGMIKIGEESEIGS